MALRDRLPHRRRLGDEDIVAPAPEGLEIEELAHMAAARSRETDLHAVTNSGVNDSLRAVLIRNTTLKGVTCQWPLTYKRARTKQRGPIAHQQGIRKTSCSTSAFF